MGFFVSITATSPSLSSAAFRSPKASPSPSPPSKSPQTWQRDKQSSHLINPKQNYQVLQSHPDAVAVLEQFNVCQALLYCWWLSQILNKL
ncbi:hypothetical protein E2542_SST07946 [Spatholobus suberectus]|nr:hypothetical protein E2542_SST07946 [Spatholobus suberectus]